MVKQSKENAEELTLFAGDTHANPLATPGSAKAMKMTGTYGRKCLELSKSVGPIGSLEKMLLVTFQWASTKCFLTWKLAVTPQGRLLFRLVPSMPRTEEIGSGLWATPNTTDYLPQRSEEALARQANTTRKGRTRPANLREQANQETVDAWEKAQVRHGELWPTPNASDADKWSHQSKAERIAKKQQVRLPTEVSPEGGKGGSLNPTWVEWLMGYPSGWTDLKDLETQ